MSALQAVIAALPEAQRARVAQARQRRIVSKPTGRGRRDTSRLGLREVMASVRGANQNETALSVLAQAERPLTRAELAVRCGMRHSAACRVVAHLLDEGLIVERIRQICSVTGSSAHGVVLSHE